MARALTEAHIEAERRLRVAAAVGVATAWQRLPAHNRENVEEFLRHAVPIVLAAQRTSVLLTNAYIARSLGRQPFPLDPRELTGAATRNGTPPEEVYRRPFVTLWRALGDGMPWEQAQEKALARAQNLAAMDVQLSMRATADLLEREGYARYGYRRVADPSACSFCREVSGAYVKAADGFVMALHPHCGCGLEPLTEPHPAAVYLPDGTRIRPYQFGPLNDRVAVHEHGELGPVLADPKHDFTSQHEL